ncbi:hypothetical protein ACFQL7_02345 [Halocatena marina]|uniref:Uncharacterized protein n=1 Tax=Halocatena marina TaxID=2934937 RepID=A0ABD5YHH5_9EURY
MSRAWVRRTVIAPAQSRGILGRGLTARSHASSDANKALVGTGKQWK